MSAFTYFYNEFVGLKTIKVEAYKKIMKKKCGK